MIIAKKKRSRIMSDSFKYMSANIYPNCEYYITSI